MKVGEGVPLLARYVPRKEERAGRQLNETVKCRLPLDELADSVKRLEAGGVPKAHLSQALDHMHHQLGHRSTTETLLSLLRVQTAFKVAKEHAELQGYYEAEEGDAFSLLRPGQGVYIPMKPDFRDRDGVDRYDWESATVVHEPEFDMYPTAQMVFPISEWHWKDLCFTWLLDAGIGVANFVAKVNACLLLSLDGQLSEKVPLWFRTLYQSLLAASFASELIIAWWTVATTDFHILHELRRKHPLRRERRFPDKSICCRGFFSCIDLLVPITWIKFVFLRYLAVPERLISPYSSFVTKDHFGNNEQMFRTASRRSPPGLTEELAVYCTDPVRYEYRAVEGFLAKLPKFVIEDTIGFGLTVYLQVHYLNKHETTALTFALFFGFLNLLRAFQKLHRYVLAARLRRSNLVSFRNEYPERGEKGLRDFDSHPVRRLITCCTGEVPGEESLLEWKSCQAAEAEDSSSDYDSDSAASVEAGYWCRTRRPAPCPRASSRELSAFRAQPL